MAGPVGGADFASLVLAAGGFMKRLIAIGMSAIFGASPALAITFPSAAPANAVTTTLWRSGGTYAKAAIWHEQGALWMRVDPGTEADFICSSAFALVQNGQQFSSLDLLTSSGTDFCDDLYVPMVFRVTTAYGKGFDENGPVTLYYSLSLTPAIEVPAGPVVTTPTPQTPQAPAETRPLAYIGNLANLKMTCKVGSATVRAVPINPQSGNPGFACPGLTAKSGRRAIITINGTIE